MGKITGTDLQFRNGRHVVDRVVFGVRLYKRFKRGTDKKTAALWVAKQTAQILSGRYLPESKNRSLTVREILNAYWDERLSGIISEYRETRRFHLDRIDTFFGGLMIPAIPPAHGEVASGILTAASVEQYIKARSLDKNRKGDFISASTIQDEVNVLAQAINFCMGRSATFRISYDPIKGYSRPEQGEPSKIVLDEGVENGPEWQAIFSQCTQAAQSLVMCLYETAMRPIEVFSMRRNWWTECAPDRWVIEFPPKKFREKTLKGRRVPVSKRLYEVVRPILESLSPDALFFPSPHGEKKRTRHWQAFGNAVERVRVMAAAASKFSEYADFVAWAEKEKWKEQNISTAWEVRGFTGNDVTPYCLRRSRISIWDSIDGNACRYVTGHVSKKDSHNSNYVRFPLHRLFRLVGLEYNRADLRLLKSA